MISFIVIGRDEGWRLSLALQSATAAAAMFDSSEVVYVDSASADDSVATACGFPGVRVFKLTGDRNAAIARNVGARAARGSVFCFLDGDEELQAEAVGKFYSDRDGLAGDFIAGATVERHYPDRESRAAAAAVAEERAPLLARRLGAFVDRGGGGCFLIRRGLWEAAGGMRERLRTAEDTDLFLRLAGMGRPAERKREVLAVHHTTSFRLSAREGFRRLLRGDWLYSGLLFRGNLSEPLCWRRLLTVHKTAALLLASLAVFAATLNPAHLLPYLALTALRAALGLSWRGILRRRPAGPLLFPAVLLLQIGIDASFIAGLLLFWPSAPSVSYIPVRDGSAAGAPVS